MLTAQRLHRFVVSLSLCVILLSCMPETPQPAELGSQATDPAELARWETHAANVTIKRDS